MGTHESIGSVYRKIDFFSSACRAWYRPIRGVYCARMLEFHRIMLGDQVRNSAFHKALQKVVVPGKTVVADIGAGTGYLSFLAAKLGAKECHLYEFGDVIGLAKTLAQKNKGTYRFIHKHSTQVRDPIHADVIISETLGNYAWEEHLIENMNDARKRFLKPGGTLIPSRLSQWIAPVVTDRFHKEIDTWDIGESLDFSAARQMSFQNIYVRTFRPEDLLVLGEKRYDDVDFTVQNDSRRRADLSWTIAADVTVSGFAAWWECELVPGVLLSTSPSKPRTHWEQIYLPVFAPLSLKIGDILTLRLTSDSSYDVGLNVTWDVAIKRNGKTIGPSEHHDMRRGYLEG